MTQRKTNVQLVKQIMEFSRYGGFSQVFVVEAISRYAKQCSEAKAEDMDTPWLNGHAWKGVAAEIHQKLEAHLNG